MRKQGLTEEQLARAKCEDSPTGAHHWLIGKDGLGYCKYCGEDREFKTAWPPNDEHPYRQPTREG